MVAQAGSHCRFVEPRKMCHLFHKMILKTIGVKYELKKSTSYYLQIRTQKFWRHET